ncbi:hypothetical protein COCNU_10G005310 [Cocos nucifera]|uniref:Uncharacterized protein n=1 Tax=Cocos nucifera TaxID=13894 RepID=A0A8K0IMB0_COCNU|nr:hypothetical protein COCNU_10G005310 [Cocos nucifera]
MSIGAACDVLDGLCSSCIGCPIILQDTGRNLWLSILHLKPRKAGVLHHTVMVATVPLVFSLKKLWLAFVSGDLYFCLTTSEEQRLLDMFMRLHLKYFLGYVRSNLTVDVDGILFLDMSHEFRLPTGMMVLEHARVVQESVCEEVPVVHEGQL